MQFVWRTIPAFGLSASVWTGDRARGEALACRLEAGAVLVNDATCHVGAVEAAPWWGEGIGHGADSRRKRNAGDLPAALCR